MQAFALLGLSFACMTVLVVSLMDDDYESATAAFLSAITLFMLATALM